MPLDTCLLMGDPITWAVGFVNAVIWESVFQRYSVLAKTISFLGITGTLQVEERVVHLIAEKLWEPRVELKPIGAPSRNFH